ncbi:MAG: hypothetical protein WD971_11570 [Pirellulales bacterium]
MQCKYRSLIRLQRSRALLKSRPLAWQAASWRVRAILLALVVCGTLADRARAESLYAPASSCELQRAGCPQNVARWAIPSNGPSNVGYYVGGGAWTCSSSRECADLGTWGWDYQCRCFKPIVRLGWWHHPHQQGGTGSYEPDGPRVCPE